MFNVSGHAASKEQDKDELMVAVVRNQFDPIDKVLSTYRIPYQLINAADIEKPETYKLYKAIFFPCGMDVPAHERLSVSAAGKAIGSVSLNEEYHDMDIELAGENIYRFVRDGGAAYFSGHAFKPLQEALSSPFTFFSNHPFIGEEGRIIARIHGDLAIFCGENTSALYMTHSGWVAIEDASGGEILAEASYRTPLGEKTGPVSVLFKEGDGEILYTSYHNTVYSDFRRFNIYRTVAFPLIEKSASQAMWWGQNVTARIGDAVHEGENVRMYRLPVKSGVNNLYLLSKASGFQVDILDGSKRLIESLGVSGNEHTFTIDADNDGYCFVRIYPPRKQRFQIYAITMASGMQMFPHYLWVTITVIAVIIALVLGFLVLSKLFDSFKYKARPMRRF